MHWASSDGGPGLYCGEHSGDKSRLGTMNPSFGRSWCGSVTCACTAAVAMVPLPKRTRALPLLCDRMPVATDAARNSAGARPSSRTCSSRCRRRKSTGYSFLKMAVCTSALAAGAVMVEKVTLLIPQRHGHDRVGARQGARRGRLPCAGPYVLWRGLCDGCTLLHECRKLSAARHAAHSRALAAVPRGRVGVRRGAPCDGLGGRADRGPPARAGRRERKEPVCGAHAALRTAPRHRDAGRRTALAARRRPGYRDCGRQ